MLIIIIITHKFMLTMKTDYFFVKKGRPLASVPPPIYTFLLPSSPLHQGLLYRVQGGVVSARRGAAATARRHPT